MWLKKCYSNGNTESFTKIELWKHRPPDKVWQPNPCEAFEEVTIAVWTWRTMTLQSLKSCWVSGSQGRLSLSDCMKSFLTYGAQKQCCMLSDTPVTPVSESKGKSTNYTMYCGFFLGLSPSRPIQKLTEQNVDLSTFNLEKVKQKDENHFLMRSREWESFEFPFTQGSLMPFSRESSNRIVILKLPHIQLVKKQNDTFEKRKTTSKVWQNYVLGLQQNTEARTEVLCVPPFLPSLCSALLLAKSIAAAYLAPVHLSPFLGLL